MKCRNGYTCSEVEGPYLKLLIDPSLAVATLMTWESAAHTDELYRGYVVEMQLSPKTH